MSWQNIRIGKVATVLPGFAFKSKDLTDDGISVIKIGNISEDGTVDVDQTQKLPVSLFEKRYEKYILNKGDILIAMTGATAGKVGRIKSRSEEGYLLNQRVAKFIPYDMDKDFFWFVVATDAYRRKFYALGGGAAQPNMSGPQIASVEIPNPPRETQSRIASILSAYDDLIENNRRRIALLEEAARLLYREWFVHFRFPGHEHVKIVDGVPEGWEQLAISDVCVVGRGASPRPIQKFVGGDVPWFKIGDATASPSAFIFETKEHVIPEGAAKSVRLPKGELILSNSATCGVPNFTGVEGCIHDGWLYFKDLKRVSKLFLFLYLEQQQKALLQGIGEGATQKNLNTNYVGRQKFRIPSETALLETFEQMVVPIFEQIERLARLNNETAKARDLLLPRLMDGRLEV